MKFEDIEHVSCDKDDNAMSSWLGLMQKNQAS
jgi:hypothetical protein